MITDLNSFLAGVQVGLRLKTWEANADPRPPISGRFIVNEDGDFIVTEDGDYMITE